MLKTLEFDDVLCCNFSIISDLEKEMIRNWRNSNNIRKWMFTNHIISEEEHYNFMEKIINTRNDFYWLVKNKNDDYLGVISLNKIDHENKHAYVGAYANPKSKTIGIGLIFDKVITKVAFDIIKLHTLKLEIIEDNKEVIFMHRKMGFKMEGKLTEYVYRDNKWKDVIIMGITND